MTAEGGSEYDDYGKHKSGKKDKKSHHSSSSSSSSSSRKRRYDEDEAGVNTRSDRKKEAPVHHTSDDAWTKLQAQAAAARANAEAAGSAASLPSTLFSSGASLKAETPAVNQIVVPPSRQGSKQDRDVDRLKKQERDRQRLMALHAGNIPATDEGFKSHKPSKLDTNIIPLIDPEENDKDIAAKTIGMDVEEDAQFEEIELDPKPFWDDNDDDESSHTTRVKTEKKHTPRKQIEEDNDDVTMSDAPMIPVSAPTPAPVTRTNTVRFAPTAAAVPRVQQHRDPPQPVGSLHERAEALPAPLLPKQRGGKGRELPNSVPAWRPGRYTTTANIEDEPSIPPARPFATNGDISAQSLYRHGHAASMYDNITSYPHHNGHTVTNTRDHDMEEEQPATVFLVTGSNMTALVRADSLEEARSEYDSVLRTALVDGEPDEASISAFAVYLDKPHARVSCTDHSCSDSTSDDKMPDAAKVKKGGQLHLYYTTDVDTFCATAVAVSKEDAKLLIDIELYKIGFTANYYVKMFNTSTETNQTMIVMCSHFD